MRVLIVEDEQMVARRLERLLRQVLGAQLSAVRIASDLDGACVALAEDPDALLLLDLNLGGADGFELLRRARAQGHRTIVVSASFERALEAFELGVLDFIPKPFNADRLRLALQRVRAVPSAPAPALLAVSLGGRTELIPLDSVVAIHGADDYAELETRDGRKHLHSNTLSALEHTLPAQFLRAHRSHLVNLNAVRSLRVDAGGRRFLQLETGSEVAVGRRFLAGLREALPML
jgi:two-component system response regulator LytT